MSVMLVGGASEQGSSPSARFYPDSGGEKLRISALRLLNELQCITSMVLPMDFELLSFKEKNL
jgi:hypothetical protein